MAVLGDSTGGGEEAGRETNSFGGVEAGAGLNVGGGWSSGG